MKKSSIKHDVEQCVDTLHELLQNQPTECLVSVLHQVFSRWQDAKALRNEDTVKPTVEKDAWQPYGLQVAYGMLGLCMPDTTTTGIFKDRSVVVTSPTATSPTARMHSTPSRDPPPLPDSAAPLQTSPPQDGAVPSSSCTLSEEGPFVGAHAPRRRGSAGAVKKRQSILNRTSTAQMLDDVVKRDLDNSPSKRNQRHRKMKPGVGSSPARLESFGESPRAPAMGTRSSPLGLPLPSLENQESPVSSADESFSSSTNRTPGRLHVPLQNHVSSSTNTSSPPPHRFSHLSSVRPLPDSEHPRGGREAALKVNQSDEGSKEEGTADSSSDRRKGTLPTPSIAAPAVLSDDHSGVSTKSLHLGIEEQDGEISSSEERESTVVTSRKKEGPSAAAVARDKGGQNGGLDPLDIFSLKSQRILSKESNLDDLPQTSDSKPTKTRIISKDVSFKRFCTVLTQGSSSKAQYPEQSKGVPETLVTRLWRDLKWLVGLETGDPLDDDITAEETLLATGWDHNDADIGFQNHPVFESTSANELLKSPVWYKLHPGGPFKIRWDLMMAALLVYVFLSLPVRIAFNEQPEGGFFWLESVVIPVTFSLDIILNFLTGVHLPPKKTTSALQKATVRISFDSWEIASHYLKGWFWIDFISTIPIEYILDWISDGRDLGGSLEMTPRMFKLLRLIRLLKLCRVLRIQKSIVSTIEKVVSRQVLDLIFMAFSVCIMAHLISCIWVFLAMNNSDESPKGTWIENYFNRFDTSDLYPNSKNSIYLLSMYWSFATLASSSYGDVIATNQAEQIYSIVVMYLGVAVVAITTSRLTTIIAHFNARSGIIRTELERAQQYCKYRNLPGPLRRSVLQYVEVWATQKALCDEEKVLAELSPALKSQVMCYIFRAVLQSVPFFRGCDDMFLSAVLCCMQPLLYAPMDVIFEKGQHELAMYVLCNGRAAVLHDQGHVIKELSSGAYFGEIALFFGVRRTATIRAITFCDVFKLMQDKFLEIIEQYPDMRDLIDNQAEDLFKDKMACYICGEVGHIAAQCINQPTPAVSLSGSYAVIDTERRISLDSSKLRT